MPFVHLHERIDVLRGRTEDQIIAPSLAAEIEAPKSMLDGV
jgi:hypothetical protein